jgi:hypothetical protein
MIYFAQTNHMIKIGYTAKPRIRMYSLKSAYPDITLLKTINGNRSKEKELHERFKHLRKEGEWFEASQELISYIDSLSHTPMSSLNNTIEMQLGQDIKTLRLLKNLSRNTLCKKAKISLNALRHLEDGNGASVTTLVKVLVALDKIDWLKALTPQISINPLSMVKGNPRKRGTL